MVDLQIRINECRGLIAYFYNDTCPPCIALRPKVKKLVEQEFSQMELVFINTAELPDLSASYSVFASPTIIVFFDGKESFRVSKYVSLDELSDRIKRYYNLLFQ